MLLTKEVEIKLSARTIRHYEKLGYKIPKSKNCSRRLTADLGFVIKVKVFDLTDGSHVKVKVLCDYCDQEIMNPSWKTYLRQKKDNIVDKDCCRKC